MAEADIFAGLESPLIEEALFFIEPKDRSPSSEDDRQAAFATGIRRTTGLRIASVPNERRWGMKSWNRAKKLGAWWGFPDTLVAGPGRLIAFCEFKNGTSMPEQHQIVVLNTLHRMGFPVGVFRTAATAFAFLNANGFPPIRRMGL